MRFSVLGSGSRGNCVYVEQGDTAILIDNGFSGKEVAARLHNLGCGLERLRAIVVTHEHNDHIAGVGVLSRRCRLPVYATSGTFTGGEKKLGRLHKRVEFAAGDTLAIDGLEIRSFSISHDTADPVGYVIGSDRRYLGYCTDTGKASRLMALRLAGCHGLILEFNHNPEMLKNGPYPPMLQQRVRSSHGHLANEDGAALLRELVHPQLQMAILAHLSETNNTPELALQAAVPCLPADHEIRLLVAHQNHATSLFSLD